MVVIEKTEKTENGWSAGNKKDSIDLL